MGIEQGDVLFEKCNVPASAKKLKAQGGRYVLVEGEVTGHAHAVYDIGACEMFEENGTFYIRAKEQTVIKHEEHKPVVVEPGEYRISRVVEADPYSEEIRQVAD